METDEYPEKGNQGRKREQENKKHIHITHTGERVRVKDGWIGQRRRERHTVGEARYTVVHQSLHCLNGSV